MGGRGRLPRHSVRNGPLLAVLLVTTICFASWTAQLAVDDLGYFEGDSGVIEVDPGGAADRAGLRVGDVIVPEPLEEPGDGDRTSFWWTWRMNERMRSGEVRLAILRDGREQAMTIAVDGPTVPASLRNLKANLPYLPTAVTFFGLALLIARRPRRDHPARAPLAIGLACCGSYFILLGQPDAPRWVLILVGLRSAFSVIGFTLVAQGVCALSNPAALSTARVRLISLVGFGSALGIGLDVFAVTPAMSPSNVLVFAAHAFLFVVISGVLMQEWRAAEEASARRENRLIFLLVAGGLMVPLLLIAAPSTFAGVWVPEYLAVPWQMFMIVPIALTAALARRGLVELDGPLPAVVLHATVLGVSLLLYLQLSSLADGLLAGPVATDAARWVGVAAVIVVAEPLRALLRRGFDRLFARDRFVLIAGCSRVSAELARIDDPATIELAVRNGLQTHNARLCSLRELGVEAEQLAIRGTLRAVELTASDRSELVARGLDTLVHVPADDGERRALAISLPLAGASWGQIEREALASVGQVVGSMLRQRTARMALEARVSRGEAERREIAMELHDGLGATLTAARLMTQMARRAGPGAPADETLEGLEETLQSGLHDLRVTLWNLDERELTWGELVSRLRRQLVEVCGSARVSLALSSELPEDGSGGPAAGLAVFRVIQEACTNTVKHARASRIRCSLRPKDHGVQLVFEDDGVGLPSPRPVGGRGLGNMTRRIESLGGSIQFSRPSHGGTRIDAWLPTGAPHEHAVSGDASIGHAG